MGSRMRFYSLSAVVLGIALGLAACTASPAPPAANPGWARIETPALTPDPAGAARCRRRYQQAVQLCRNLYNAPESTRYHDDHWRQNCLEQAKRQYQSCLEYCGSQGRPHQ